MKVTFNTKSIAEDLQKNVLKGNISIHNVITYQNDLSTDLSKLASTQSSESSEIEKLATQIQTAKENINSELVKLSQLKLTKA